MAAAGAGSEVRAEIVAALDDWASITSDRRRRSWLLAVARGIDPDPARIAFASRRSGRTVPC